MKVNCKIVSQVYTVNTHYNRHLTHTNFLLQLLPTVLAVVMHALHTFFMYNKGSIPTFWVLLHSILPPNKVVKMI